MKASLTALDFAALLRESLAGVEGLRLQSVWGLGEAIVLRLREPLAGERVLVLSPSLGFFETRFELPRGEVPARLAAALRGLRGSRVMCVRQLNLDRVAALTLERGTELVVEWVREGNLLVVEGGRISAALRQREMRDRRLVAGELYRPPPQRGLDPLSATPLDVFPPAKPGATAAAHLSKLVSAPGEIVAEALHRAGIDPRSSALQLEAGDLWRALVEVRDLYLRVLRGELEPCVAVEGGEPVAAYPVKLEHLGAELEPAGSFTEAVDRVLSPRLVRQPEAEEGGLAKAERIARSYEERAAALRRAAAAIMADPGRFEGVLESFRGLRSSTRWDQLLAALRARHPEVVSVEPERGRVVLSVEGVEVELDASLSAARNASLLFGRAKELERKAARAREVASTVEPKLELRQALKPRRERRWYESFHHFTSSEGLLVIGGRDASQNEAIVRKYMAPSDLFLHADIHGGPAVVVKAEGRAVGEATLREAAQLAAAYSRAWELGFASVDVYWVSAQQVSKRAPAGEYLGRGAFMIHGGRNYLRSVKLELAVGVRVANGSYELLAGPPSALERACDALVVLEPGRVPREEAARKVSEILTSSLRARGLRARVSAHEVLQRLPRGGFYVARAIGGGASG